VPTVVLKAREFAWCLKLPEPTIDVVDLLLHGVGVRLIEVGRIKGSFGVYAEVAEVLDAH